ncbi:MAG TPA: hypothetical protein PLG61_03845, partial [Methanoregulaceae archaeon]|nr:hypothetical protein [Methanoregulaceae archaeon]
MATIRSSPPHTKIARRHIFPHTDCTGITSPVFCGRYQLLPPSLGVFSDPPFAACRKRFTRGNLSMNRRPPAVERFLISLLTWVRQDHLP